MTGVFVRRRCLGGAAVVVAAAVGVALAPGVATAVEPSTYAQPSVDGGPGAWTGDMDTPAVGFPAATIASTVPVLAVQPPGDSGYLNETTPFGAVFGSSQPQSSLAVTQDAVNPDTTVLTFETPTPAGWAFALTDVNDEEVQISGTGADGAPLTVDQLGYSAENGAFNYCNGDPLPADCPGPNSEVPSPELENPGVWIGVPGDAGIGGSLWFQPTVPVTSLSIMSQTQPEAGGLSTYRLWMATRVASISGNVSQVANGEASPLAGATLNLLTVDGQPVLDPSGNPVTTESEADGSYSFDDVARGPFLVSINPPPGLEGATGPLEADTTTGNVEGVNFTFNAPVPPGPGPNPGTDPQPAAPPQPDPQLAATGTSNTIPLAAGGLGALALGGLLLVAARARKHESHN